MSQHLWSLDPVAIPGDLPSEIYLRSLKVLFYLLSSLSGGSRSLRDSYDLTILDEDTGREPPFPSLLPLHASVVTCPVCPATARTSACSPVPTSYTQFAKSRTDCH